MYICPNHRLHKEMLALADVVVLENTCPLSGRYVGFFLGKESVFSPGRPLA